MLRSGLLLLAVLFAPLARATDAVASFAEKIAPLIDPAKLVSLRERGANPRVQKAVYWLAKAREDKAEPAKVVDAALLAVGMKNRAAEMTKTALLRNLTIAEQLGCLDEEGLAEMRKGNAATVKRGPYAGDQLSVDHIIPRSVCPELDNVIANLELMPERMPVRVRPDGKRRDGCYSPLPMLYRNSYPGWSHSLCLIVSAIIMTPIAIVVVAVILVSEDKVSRFCRIKFLTVFKS